MAEFFFRPKGKKPGPRPKRRLRYQGIDFFTGPELEMIFRGLNKLATTPEYMHEHRRAVQCIRFLFATGVRATEATQVRLEDCAPTYVHIRHGKGDKPRDVAVIPELLDHYHDLLGEAEAIEQNIGWLFPSLWHKKAGEAPISYEGLFRWWKEAFKAIGLERREDRLSPHAARRTFGTWFVYRMGIEALMQQMGHTDVRIVVRYYLGQNPELRFEEYRMAKPEWLRVAAQGRLEEPNPEALSEEELERPVFKLIQGGLK